MSRPVTQQITQRPQREPAIKYNLMMKSLLFDFGGTLDADGTTWLERFYPMYKEAGLDFPKDRFDRAFYDSDDNLPARHALKGLDLAQTVRLQVEDVIKALAPDRGDLIDPITGRFVSDCRSQFKRLTPPRAPRPALSPRHCVEFLWKPRWNPECRRPAPAFLGRG